MANEDIFAQEPFEIKKENYQDEPSFLERLSQMQVDLAQREMQKQKGATDLVTDFGEAVANMTPAQKAYFFSMPFPPSGIADISGGLAQFPDQDIMLSDLPQYMIEAEKYPSIGENIQEGRYGDAALQGIGGLGDAAFVAATPFVGPVVASAIKAPLEGIASLALLAKAFKQGKIGKQKHGISTEGSDFELPLSDIKFEADISGMPIRSTEDRMTLADKLLTQGELGFEYKGVKANPRQPLEVLRTDDGFELLGGKSTFEALNRRDDVSQVPVKVFNNKAEFEEYDYLRKDAKIKQRREDAKKLLPEVGNPTFEIPLQTISPKLEKEVASQFTAKHNNLFSTVENQVEMANKARAKAGKMAPEFVAEIEDIAAGVRDSYLRNIPEAQKDEYFKLTVNPGESAKLEMDPDFPEVVAGTVKKTPRMIEKANQKYDGNIGRVTDFLRMRVIAETTDEAELVAQAIHKKFPSIDSNLQVNPHGYRDRKLNIVFKDKDGEEIVAEISIGPSGHQVAAENNHGFYEEWRALQTKYQGQEKLPKVVDATMDDLVGIMQKEFARADELIDKSWIEKTTKK